MAAQSQRDPARTELVSPPAVSAAGRAPVPGNGDAAYDGGQNGRGPLAAVAAGSRRTWLIGGLVVLLLLALVVIVPLASRGSGDRDKDGTLGSVPNSQPAGTTPTVATTAPPTPATTTSAPPPVTPTGQPGQQQLPPGWRLYRDRSGFSVPVPTGWTVSHDGPRVKFNDPGSRRFLMIDQTNNPRPDPVADWTQQERSRRGTYNNYQRVTIRAVAYWLKAADWEWLHTEDGVRMHVRNRGFVTSAKKAYAIRWDTEANEWDTELATFQIIADGFQPAKS